MSEDRKRFVIMLRFMMDLEINADNLDKHFAGISFHDNKDVLATLNKTSGLNKKEKFDVLSKVLEIIEGRKTSPESLRKWYITRCNDCLSMMNGDPPRSMHTMESLQILIEKSEENKK